MSTPSDSVVSSLKGLKISRVSTVPFFVLTQLSAQLTALADAGADVHVSCSADEMSSELDTLKKITLRSVPISREISLLQDLRSLVLLVRLFRKEKYDIVHSTTPKAGLLCAVAGRLAGVKTRLHTFTGQPWVTMKGPKKVMLRWFDRVIVALNTHCFTDSPSQTQFLIADGIASEHQISVVGAGSLAGVDTLRFDSARFTAADNSALRAETGIPEGSKVILFVGRVTADKGLRELLAAFRTISAQQTDAYLLFVGPFEAEGEAILQASMGEPMASRIKTIGFSSAPETYMSIASLLCIPSYREGFGTVVIEAAAMSLPAVGTDIYGLSDAIVAGETGMLVPPRDSAALAKALAQMLSDHALRSRMAANARARAHACFDSRIISDQLILEYRRYAK